jgi:hypothetical protein
MNVRMYLRLLMWSALTALVVCCAALAPAIAMADDDDDDDGPVARTAAANAVESTTATLNGTVDPGERDTRYFFIYGTTTSYGLRTSAFDVPEGPPVAVSAPVTGLTPGATYHFRLVAFHIHHCHERDRGEDVSFTTEPLAPPTAATAPTPSAPSPVEATPTTTTTTTTTTPTTAPAPQVAAPAPTATLGTSVVVAPVTGTIGVRVPGAAGFTPIAAGTAVPDGAVLDTRSGTVELTTALPDGTTQTATFHSGVFQVRQSTSGVTDIFLRGPALNCPPARASARAAAVAKRKPRRRQLWGRDHGGRFRTHGKNSVATVRGTSWVTTDTCRGTRTTVRSGAVSVRDVHRHRTVLVRAGHSYLARRK